jgi:cold shock CspA family protein
LKISIESLFSERHLRPLIAAQIIYSSTMPSSTMTMATTVAAPVNRSWAQLVKPESKQEANAKEIVKPARRGSLLRSCQGEVLKMLNNYGWLMVYGTIDHPSAQKHGGDVYIHKDDIMDGEELSSGDIVTFFLYADEQGLGAEMVRVEQKAPVPKYNAKAAAFVPSQSGCNAKAVPFVPSGFSMNVSANEFVMPSVWPQPVVMPRAWAQPVDPEVDQAEIGGMTDVFKRLSQVFACDDEEAEQEYDVDMASIIAKKLPSSDGSTHDQSSDGSSSHGETSSDGSDSDIDDEFEMLAEWTMRCPPGMPLPANFRPPPGLEAF